MNNMKKSDFVYEVVNLVRAKHGVSFDEHLDTQDSLDFDDYKAVSNIKADLSFMRIEGGVHVLVENLSVEVQFKCTKCACEFTKKIAVQQAQRVFYFEEQEVEDESDQYYVDIKHMEVDLSEFIRQEIILHFPMIPVCLSSCKGLCFRCGTNLNKKNCNCKDSKKDNPLSILKNLIKD